MYKRKSIKFVAILLTLCLLLTAFSGSAIQAQAEELGIMPIGTESTSSTFDNTEFFINQFYDGDTFGVSRLYILNATNFVNTIYSREFDIDVSATGSPMLDTVTGIDDCQRGENPCNNSVCGSTSEHHKDVENISDSLLAWRNNLYSSELASKVIVVFWADYESGTFCDYQYNDSLGTATHNYLSSYACVVRHQPAVLVLDVPFETSAERAPYMSILLAHEIAHCFGADDMYYNQVPQEHRSDIEWQCLVGSIDDDGQKAIEYYHKVENGTANAFCTACRSAINSGLLYWPDVG